MSLIYSLVAREGLVLVDYSPYSGNFHLISLEVLKNVAPSPPAPPFKHFLILPKHAIFTYAKDGLVFLLMAESAYEPRIAVKFLKQVQEDFFGRCDSAARSGAAAHSLGGFRPVLEQWMRKYEDRAEVDKMRKLQEELSELEEQALCSMDKVIERGEKIEVIVEKTNLVSELSYDIRELASETRRRMWWKKMRVKIAIAAVCLIALAVVVLLVI